MRRRQSTSRLRQPDASAKFECPIWGIHFLAINQIQQGCLRLLTDKRLDKLQPACCRSPPTWTATLGRTRPHPPERAKSHIGSTGPIRREARAYPPDRLEQLQFKSMPGTWLNLERRSCHYICFATCIVGMTVFLYIVINIARTMVIAAATRWKVGGQARRWPLSYPTHARHFRGSRRGRLRTVAIHFDQPEGAPPPPERHRGRRGSSRWHGSWHSDNTIAGFFS